MWIYLPLWKGTLTIKFIQMLDLPENSPINVFDFFVVPWFSRKRCLYFNIDNITQYVSSPVALKIPPWNFHRGVTPQRGCNIEQS